MATCVAVCAAVCASAAASRDPDPAAELEVWRAHVGCGDGPLQAQAAERQRRGARVAQRGHEAQLGAAASVEASYRTQTQLHTQRLRRRAPGVRAGSRQQQQSGAEHDSSRGVGVASSSRGAACVLPREFRQAFLQLPTYALVPAASPSQGLAQPSVWPVAALTSLCFSSNCCGSGFFLEVAASVLAIACIMPPRRSSRLVASPVALLPPVLLERCLLALPVDSRARAACVSRGWRSVLADPRLWTRLDLSPSSGVTVCVTEAVLRGAAARARGQLVALDISDCFNMIGFRVARDVLAANANSLCELRVLGLRYLELPEPWTMTLDALLRSAPRLQSLHTDWWGRQTGGDMRALRGEAPYACVRLHSVHCSSVTDFPGLTAALAGHPTLQSVSLYGAQLGAPGVLDAFVDMAITRRLRVITLSNCHLLPAALGALVAAYSPALRLLDVSHCRLADEGLGLLVEALRTNTHLEVLQCRSNGMSARFARTRLLPAVRANASLRRLEVTSTCRHPAAVTAERVVARRTTAA